METGELKVEPARRTGRLPKEQQAGEAQKVIAAAKTPRKRRHDPVAEQDDASAVNGVNTSPSTSVPAVPDGATVNGVNTSADAVSPDSPTAPTVNTVNTPETQAAEQTGQDDPGQPRQLPYGDPFSVVTHPN
ncbi:hypothetical protein [Streptomyces sp. NBC_00016]|uniref:hypothetical protein n=1 Tax=unclassified Streptomyces TaxID=2593676 RepID=UPI002F90C88E